MDNEEEIQIHSLRERVFQALENDIIKGVYQSGEALNEKRLSYEYGVSRTPIREAFRQLELEGLVKSIPNKGVVVTGISREDIRDIYSIRMVIEGLATRWATEKITADELKELQDALELEEFYTLKSDIEQILRCDHKFHMTVFKASKSNPLMYMLCTFNNYIQNAKNLSLKYPGRAEKTLTEHKAIAQAIREKNAEKAEQLTAKHIMNAFENICRDELKVYSESNISECNI